MQESLWKSEREGQWFNWHASKQKLPLTFLTLVRWLADTVQYSDHLLTVRLASVSSRYRMCSVCLVAIVYTSIVRYALFYYLLCHHGKQTKTQLAHIKRKARGIKTKRPLNYHLNSVSAKQSSVTGKISIPRSRSFARLQVTKLFKRGKQGYCPRMKNQATSFFVVYTGMTERHQCHQSSNKEKALLLLIIKNTEVGI